MARWTSASVDGSSKIEAAAGREDDLVVAIMSHVAADGHVEGLLRIEARIRGGLAVPVTCVVGDPPTEIPLPDAVDLFAHMSAGMGPMAFQPAHLAGRPGKAAA